MNEDQFKEIKERLDKIIVMLAIQGQMDINKKIEILKHLGFTSYEIGDLFGIANVRQTKGWAKK